MGKPYDHAVTSAQKLGGEPEDYLDIHELMDSSRKAFPDLRHRTLTHTSWFITEILPRIFGETRVNSDGDTYSVKDVGEQHALEDYGNNFIPSVQDFLTEMEVRPWMLNSKDDAVPASCTSPATRRKVELQEEVIDEIGIGDNSPRSLFGMETLIDKR